MTEPVDARFHDAYDAAGLNVAGLWLRYVAIGGEASELEVDAYLNGAMALTPFQHDMLAHAINERLDEIAPPKAPYSGTTRHEVIDENLGDGRRDRPG
jgi:hypothetical protein